MEISVKKQNSKVLVGQRREDCDTLPSLCRCRAAQPAAVLTLLYTVLTDGGHSSAWRIDWVLISCRAWSRKVTLLPSLPFLQSTIIGRELVQLACSTNIIVRVWAICGAKDSASCNCGSFGALAPELCLSTLHEQGGFTLASVGQSITKSASTEGGFGTHCNTTVTIHSKCPDATGIYQGTQGTMYHILPLWTQILQSNLSYTLCITSLDSNRVKFTAHSPRTRAVGITIHSTSWILPAEGFIHITQYQSHRNWCHKS